MLAALAIVGSLRLLRGATSNEEPIDRNAQRARELRREIGWQASRNAAEASSDNPIGNRSLSRRRRRCRPRKHRTDPDVASRNASLAAIESLANEEGPHDRQIVRDSRSGILDLAEGEEVVRRDSSVRDEVKLSGRVDLVSLAPPELQGLVVGQEGDLRKKGRLQLVAEGVTGSEGHHETLEGRIGDEAES